MMNDTEYASLLDRDIAHLIHPQYHQSDQRNGIVFVKGEGDLRSIWRPCRIHEISTRIGL